MVRHIIESRAHLAALLVTLAVLFMFAARDASAQPSSGTITGYAWSETIGWISLDGDGYGVSVATDGDLSGYAWSDNIGWVSANPDDVAGCPSAPCAPHLEDGELTGWLRALSGGTSQSGDWGGWISLSGANYGPTAVGGGTFSGYAWGSDVVGWVDFSYAQTNYTGQCAVQYACSANSIVRTNVSCDTEVIATCETPFFCSAGSAVCLSNEPEFVSSGDGSGHLQVRPSIVARNSPARVYWNVENVESCEVSGSNGQSWSGTASAAGGTVTAGIIQRTTFTLTCERLDGGTFSESAVVNLVPIFNES